MARLLNTSQRHSGEFARPSGDEVKDEPAEGGVPRRLQTLSNCSQSPAKPQVLVQCIRRNHLISPDRVEVNVTITTPKDKGESGNNVLSASYDFKLKRSWNGSESIDVTDLYLRSRKSGGLVDSPATAHKPHEGHVLPSVTQQIAEQLSQSNVKMKIKAMPSYFSFVDLGFKKTDERVKGVKRLKFNKSVQYVNFSASSKDVAAFLDEKEAPQQVVE
jgi:hypothetical protein